MNSVALGTGGYALLFSSFLTLISLSRKQLRQSASTSFYMTAISDLLHSILTAVILLRNHVKMLLASDSNTRMGMNTTWIDTDYNSTVSCSTTDVVMEYAMLLIPLVNTFISLLALSIQCNLRVLCLSKECTAVLQPEDSTLNEKISERNRILTFLKSSRVEVKSRKILSVLVVLLQYVMPVIVTGSLYTVQNDNYNGSDYETDIDCKIFTNFPFQIDSELENTTDVSSNMFFNNFYINNGDVLRAPSANNSQMDDILSKVQGIVLSTLNESDSTSSFYNKSELADVTKFIEESSNSPQLDDTIGITESTSDNYETSSVQDTSVDQQISEETTALYIEEASTMSQYDIYKDILKRIHGKVSAMKKQYGNKRHDKKANLFDEYVLDQSNILDQILPHTETSDLYVPFNKCLLSSKYLKLYVLLLVLLIYCFPIALVSTLQMWGIVSCQYLYEKLDTQEKSVKNTLSKSVKGFCYEEQSTSSDSVELPRDQFSVEIEEAPSIKLKCTEIMRATSNMTRTLNIIKISLVLASLLWSPILLQLMLQLFLCMRTPDWLMQAAYLMAIAFCIARNIFNVSVVKLQEVCARIPKRNSIHPSE